MTHLMRLMPAMALVASVQIAAPRPAKAEDARATTNDTSGTVKDDNTFKLRDSTTARQAHGVRPSIIKPTKTEAALRLFVIDKDQGPIEGIVISLVAPDGTKYFTEETDALGYAEVLVPVGQTYDVVYLSLGRRDVSAKVTVENRPNYNLKLTLRYQRRPPRTVNIKGENRPQFVLDGVQFASGNATLTPDSFARLDTVVEYMTHRKSVRIEISGHTDNVGNPRRNMELSKKRAEACRDYLVAKNIEPGRIETVGYGDTRPIASNDTEQGRQENRRIEAVER